MAAKDQEVRRYRKITNRDGGQIGLEDSNKNETVEECVEKIVKFAKEKLKVTIDNADIDIAHRLGMFQRDKPRNIICKFTHRRTKFEIIKQRKVLKGSRCYIVEDLTRTNQQRLKEAFELRCVERSWSTDGKLFVLLKNGKKRRLQYNTILTESFLMNDANFNRK
ncbi:uncharacterized protein LOC117315171 [Pecten maximus]|uniref:uncharacterized protein LOC117315171 n=1 Tax=Pecten maximus TaxID=6579 RepID=UPI001457ED51|nr:uncharacterized protein LOC117315171 [Pecten maximus]